MLELISVHVPKTAGHSLMAVMKDVYGQSGFLRVNVRRDSMEVFDQIPAREVRADVGIQNVIPAGTKVLHGHYTYRDISHIREKDALPVIAWVRDPVERIVSDYYYAQRNVRDGTWAHKQHLRDMSFREWAQREGRQNTMSRLLEGLPLSEYFFIGVTEHYEQDLRDLAYLMGWGGVKTYRRNVTAETRTELGPISESDRDMARNINSEDFELYEAALRLRAKRRKMIGRRSGEGMGLLRRSGEGIGPLRRSGEGIGPLRRSGEGIGLLLKRRAIAVLKKVPVLNHPMRHIYRRFFKRTD